jgi:hypothetical protein
MAGMPAPEYQSPKEQASALLRLALLLPFAEALVGGEQRKGIRFVIGPIAIESYTCFEEPALAPWKGIRFIFWKMLKKEKVPQGWRRWRGIKMGNTNAVARVHADFLKDWTANARRIITGRKSRLPHKRISVEAFGSAYHASGYLDPFLRHGFIRVVKDHLKVHSEDVHVLLFYTDNMQVAGGTVFVDYPDINQSHYLISFLTAEGRREHAGYEFIYWWYQHMLERGIPWADFGIVWAPGDPQSWIGYSNFKKRFHPNFYTRATYWKRG